MTILAWHGSSPALIRFSQYGVRRTTSATTATTVRYSDCHAQTVNSIELFLLDDVVASLYSDIICTNFIHSRQNMSERCLFHSSFHSSTFIQHNINSIKRWLHISFHKIACDLKIEIFDKIFFLTIISGIRYNNFYHIIT